MQLPLAALATADLVVLVVCGLLALRGAFKGFAWQAVRLVGLVGAVWAATAYHEPVGAWLVERVDPIPDEWGGAAGFLAILIGVWLIASFLAHMARGAIRTADLTGADRFFGLLLGAVMGLVVATVGYSIYGKLSSTDDLKGTLEDSLSAQAMGQFVKLVRPVAPDFVKDKWGAVLDAIEGEG